MRPATYPTYLEAAVTGYAEENVAAGRWPELGALARSREDFLSLLPGGLATPDNFLFEIAENETCPTIGFVWCALETKHGSCTAYIYDLEIAASHRRRGHARRALQLLESTAIAAGASSIGLNVFANNAGAQSLYRQLGYAPTNLNMRKMLECP